MNLRQTVGIAFLRAANNDERGGSLGGTIDGLPARVEVQESRRKWLLAEARNFRKDENGQWLLSTRRHSAPSCGEGTQRRAANNRSKLGLPRSLRLYACPGFHSNTEISADLHSGEPRRSCLSPARPSLAKRESRRELLDTRHYRLSARRGSSPVRLVFSWSESLLLNGNW